VFEKGNKTVGWIRVRISVVTLQHPSLSFLNFDYAHTGLTGRIARTTWTRYRVCHVERCHKAKAPGNLRDSIRACIVSRWGVMTEGTLFDVRWLKIDFTVEIGYSW